MHDSIFGEGMAFVKKCRFFCTSVTSSSENDVIPSADKSKQMEGTPLPSELDFYWLKTF